MKIFQVLNYFLPQQTAGTEVYTWALSKQLQKLGHEVQIVIPNYGKPLSEEYFYDDLQVHKFEETSVMDRNLIMGFKDSNGLDFFKKYVEKHKPDIVHFHEIAAGDGISLKHILAAKNSGAKIIFTFHLAGYSCKTGTLFYKQKELCNGKINIGKCGACYLQSKNASKLKYVLNPASQLLYKLNVNSTQWNNKFGTALGTSYLIEKQKRDLHTLIGYCNKVITLTAWYKNVLLLNDVSLNKIEHISQGLPFNILKQKTRNRDTKHSLLRLMFLGRISYFKGLHLLIEAVLKLPAGGISLSIYGQPDGSDYEQTLKEKTKFSSHINWGGTLKQNEVLQIMQEHDVLCLCSTFSEMSPLVIQEAFAAGIPVLASNVYGNAEQIKEHENGWLFKFNDADNLKLKIQYILHHPNEVREIKDKLKKYTATSFQHISEKYETIYKTVVNEIS